MAATILKRQNKLLFAFSAVLPEGYQGRGTDERVFIDQFKSFENIDLCYVTNGARGPFDNLDRLVWGGEQPRYMSRHYQYTAFAEAAVEKGCRLILEGVGGELGPSFHGDGIMAEWLLRGKWLTLTAELRKRTAIEDLSLWRLLKGEVIKPLVPGFILDRRPRFDICQSFESSPIRKSFVEQYLGQDLLQDIRAVDQAVRPRADHLENQLSAISLSIGGGGGNYYVGYEQIRTFYPFFDLRVLNLCLAAPAHLKIRNGYKRNLVRIGMKGILPEKLRYRTSKEPLGPDFHDRYNRQRLQVVDYLARIKPDDPVRMIVDIPKLQRMTGHIMATNRCDTPLDFAAMHSVPFGMYLVAFLKRFESYWK